MTQIRFTNPMLLDPPMTRCAAALKSVIMKGSAFHERQAAG